MEWIPESYEDLVPVLDAALSALDGEPLNLTAIQILEVLSGDAPSGEAEAACRQLARTGTVPVELAGQARWLTSCRVRCARWYCHDMAYSDAWGRCAREILEGLLTDYWDDVGRFDWLQEDVLAGDFQQPE